MQPIRVTGVCAAVVAVLVAGCGGSVPDAKDLQRSFDQKLPESCKSFVKFSDLEKTNGYADGENYQVEYKGKLTITPPKDWAEGEVKKAGIQKKYQEELKAVVLPERDAINDAVSEFNAAVNEVNSARRLVPFGNPEEGAAKVKVAQEKFDQAKIKFDQTLKESVEAYTKAIKLNQTYAAQVGVSPPKMPEPFESGKIEPGSFRFTEYVRAAEPLPDSAFASKLPQAYVSCFHERSIPAGALMALDQKEVNGKERYSSHEFSWSDKILMRKTEQGWSPI